MGTLAYSENPDEMSPSMIPEVSISNIIANYSSPFK